MSADRPSQWFNHPQHGPLPALLLLLTVATGVVDAVSILALGRVGHPRRLLEPHESPAQAAERDLAEELNLHRPPGRLLVVD